MKKGNVICSGESTEKWDIDVAGGQQPERDMWDEIVAAGQMVHLDDVFRSLDTSTETKHDLPSVAARLDQYFIPPLPWRLFCVLAGLPGKAWVIYLVLWRLSRMYKTASLTVTSLCLRGFGVSHDQKTRGLDALETAGLLTLERIAGKNPTVTLRPLHELFPHREPTS